MHNFDPRCIGCGSFCMGDYCPACRRFLDEAHENMSRGDTQEATVFEARGLNRKPKQENWK